MNFKKLKQLSNDIDLLEQSGKYSAAEVLHKKFIKEAQVVNNVQNYQARPGAVNQRTVYPGQGNAFERGDNFARSERGGVGTLYNFKGLDPEMEFATVPGVPGKSRQVLIPKGSDPRMADPAFAASQRTKSWENSIPGYVDFLRFKPMPYQALDFRNSGGLDSDAGKILYNELAVKSGQKPIQFSDYETQLGPAATSTATSTATPGFSLSQTPQPNSVNNARFLNTPKLDFNTTPTVTPTVTQNTNYSDQNAIVQTNLAQDTARQNANQLLQESKAKMPERIQYYDKKIQEMNDQKNPQVKENMRNTLKKYISNNHSTGILDTNSYSRFMNALGENSGYS
jgi:hypothetical protein